MRGYANDVFAANIYPGQGASLGAAATTPSGTPAQTSPAREAKQGTAKYTGNPFSFWFVFLGMLLVLMWVAHKLGEPGEFSNLKASAYNVLFIALVAVVGIPPIKLAASKIPGPWTPYVLSV